MLRPAGGAVPPSPAGLRIEVIQDAAGLHAFEAAMVRGFQLHELEGYVPGVAFSAATLADERQQLWAGWEDDRPVSAAASFVAAGVTDVTLVATVPEARGRGYGAALTWRATLADATLPALLLATAEGRAMYERMGYTSLFRFAMWSRERPRGTT
jgi:GNAT superfamily N-acetyltransferase